MGSGGSKAVERMLAVTTLHGLLRLAFGRVPAEPADWAALYSAAERERLLALTWKRSAEIVQRFAPAETSARWRQRAVGHGLHAERQLVALATLTSALLKEGIQVAVLKGAPLAQRVHGDFTVRPSIDLDIYVPGSQRVRATEILSSIGWRWMSGSAPEEETFAHSSGEFPLRLEVHSSALDDPLLQHVDLMVECEQVAVGGYLIPAHGGAYLPAYLAAHLAKHNEKPLLWVLDLFLLWSSLEKAERVDAFAAARTVGLEDHLRWALRISSFVSAYDGELPNASRRLRRLSRALAVHGNMRRTLRLIGLSHSPAAVWHVVSGRMLPGSGRMALRNAPRYLVTRAVRWAYRRTVFERPSNMSPRDRAGGVIHLSGRESEARVRAALALGSVWVSPADGAMEPAIPSFGTARVISAPGLTLRVGAVVLVAHSVHGCVLRRIASLSDASIGVAADVDLGQREPLRVPRSAVIGVCDLVDVGNRRVPLESRPFGPLALLRAIFRAGVAPLLSSRGT